jgi:hypothetical protein
MSGLLRLGVVQVQVVIGTMVPRLKFPKNFCVRTFRFSRNKNNIRKYLMPPAHSYS